MEVPMQQTNLETDKAKLDAKGSRVLKYKDQGNSMRFIFLTMVLFGVVIALVMFQGQITTLFTQDTEYVANRVDVIEGQTIRLTQSVRDQQQAIHSFEVRFADNKNQTEQKFQELEQRILQIEKEMQGFHLAQVTSYKVRPGDTLWSITVRHYGTGKYMLPLAQYNNLSNPRHVVSGSILKIPPASYFSGLKK
ncbi:hypothetical protein BHU72_02855 [Desulfuribacillus stibiiarsenatis]|uniref:LysM domain-containing protein n=2 Tax=Desulfuribacillus stibiiarsenatis TaxID=1390249 RepID=A0A1E5L6E9_9FIRM|nr:hypothetical protein BHU72_02855 [Desulfuribacillus stibiiarsenatis]